MSTTAPFRHAHRAADYLDTAPEPVPATSDVEHEVDDETPVDFAPSMVSPEVEERIDLGALPPDVPSTGATTGLRGVATRLGFHVAPSSAEIAQRERAAMLAGCEATIRQTTWPRAVGILIANRKGGVGKTPTAVLLGGVLAAIRGGSVAVMEVSDDPGTLTFRAEGTPQRGIGELVADTEQIHSAGQLASYTAPQTSFASVIGTVGARRNLSGDDVVRTAQVIDRYYGIRVMDSGNQPTSSAFAGALAVTDGLVIPILNTAEAALEAIDLLRLLRDGDQYAHLADTATVLRLTDGRPESTEVLTRLDRSLEQNRVGQVFEIPFDAHIAERGPLTLSRLAPATRDAFTVAAAGILTTVRTTS